MARRPGHALELLGMRRFGDRRPQGNLVVISDDVNVHTVCRQKLSMFTLRVESFLPYDLDLCFDLDVWVVMSGPTDKIRQALRRARPRSALFDTSAEAFWSWIEWLIENRAGRTALGCPEWHAQRKHTHRAAAAVET